MTLGQTQVGPIEKVPLKSRVRAIYWREHPQGSGNWVQTNPLPADASGRENYLNKGFRLKPPGEPEPESPLVAENRLLKQQLQMAKAREAKAEKKETLSGSL